MTGGADPNCDPDGPPTGMTGMCHHALLGEGDGSVSKVLAV